MPINKKPIRVLVVDDSSTVRMILTKELSKDEDIEVVGAASDPFIARDMILDLDPDVVTLDINMPKMDGLTFLQKIMKYHPLPVIIISSTTSAGSENAIRALELGAVEVLGKPEGKSLKEINEELTDKIKIASKALVRLPSGKTAIRSSHKKTVSRESLSQSKSIIAIGSSTGGTEAIKDVIYRLPSAIPGIVIAQHMPSYFIHHFADRLNRECDLYVKVAEDGDVVTDGTVLVAPGGLHSTIKRRGAQFVISLNDGPKVNFQKPSVDVLFDSVAEVAGDKAIGVILTGMG
ncbi:MAG: chemotaxis-specific protein-glutamate methyltransferase CheB, partial [Spirochaetota bacterium]|nr:chemotaxis-specific protein-glutamate methyltransferase CheB [Spirochaetota bacterium]